MKHFVAQLVRPIKELKAFKRIHIPTGRSAEVKIVLPVDLLSSTIGGTRRIVEPGGFEIMLGAPSADIKFRDTVSVTGRTRTLCDRCRMHSSTAFGIT